MILRYISVLCKSSKVLKCMELLLLLSVRILLYLYEIDIDKKKGGGELLSARKILYIYI